MQPSSYNSKTNEYVLFILLYKLHRHQRQLQSQFSSSTRRDTPDTYSLQRTRLQLARDVGKLALLQLRLPEYRVRISEAVLHPSLFLNMVQVDKTTRVGITMRSRQDTSSSELQGILNAQVIVVLGVQHTIRKSLTGTYAEQVSLKPGTVAVDVVQRRAFLLGHAGAHGAHAESHALVAVDQVGEDLAGGGDADAALVSELVEAALHA